MSYGCDRGEVFVVGVGEDCCTAKEAREGTRVLFLKDVQVVVLELVDDDADDKLGLLLLDRSRLLLGEEAGKGDTEEDRRTGGHRSLVYQVPVTS